jgi:hypothetical protein
MQRAGGSNSTGQEGAPPVSGACTTQEPHSVAVPAGMLPLPYALASPAALQVLKWLADAVKKGVMAAFGATGCIPCTDLFLARSPDNMREIAAPLFGVSAQALQICVEA